MCAKPSHRSGSGAEVAHCHAGRLLHQLLLKAEPGPKESALLAWYPPGYLADKLNVEPGHQLLAVLCYLLSLPKVVWSAQQIVVVECE